MHSNTSFDIHTVMRLIKMLWILSCNIRMSAPCNCPVSEIHWAVVGWEIEIYFEEVPDETDN